MSLCLCIRLRSFLYPWAVIHRTCCHYLLLWSNKAKDCLLCTSFYWNGQEDEEVLWATLPECSAEGRTVAHMAGKAPVLMESEPSSHGDVVSDEMRIQSLKYSPILMIHILITYKNKSLINTLFLSVECNVFLSFSWFTRPHTRWVFSLRVGAMLYFGGMLKRKRKHWKMCSWWSLLLNKMVSD